MSYTFLQEQEEESSVDSFSDIPPSVLSRLNLTAGRCFSNDNGTESSLNSQSGMTSEIDKYAIITSCQKRNTFMGHLESALFAKQSFAQKIRAVSKNAAQMIAGANYRQLKRRRNARFAGKSLCLLALDMRVVAESAQGDSGLNDTPPTRWSLSAEKWHPSAARLSRGA